MTSQDRIFLLELVYSTDISIICIRNSININSIFEVFLLHVTNLFRAEIGKFDFFMWKNANLLTFKGSLGRAVPPRPSNLDPI